LDTSTLFGTHYYAIRLVPLKFSFKWSDDTLLCG